MNEVPAQILLAHPREDSLRVLAEVLEEEGHRVVRVTDEVELLEELADAEVPFDLVVTAVHLHDCTALDVLEEVRGSGIETPFVLLNWGREDVSREATGLDALVLDYPFHVDEVVAAVDDVLSDLPSDGRTAA